MINNEKVEKIAVALSHLHYIPSFHKTVLFSNDLKEIMGFQVYCNLNEDGRIVFSINEKDVETFNQKFFDLFRFRPHTKGKAKAGATYLSSGSDRIEDIAPATIAKLVQKESRENEEVDIAFTVILMKMNEEITKWENYYKTMYENTSNLKSLTNMIVDNSN